MIGDFIWYELGTTDTDAAKAFYSRVVGWEASEGGPLHAGYTILSAGGRGVGGMMALPEQALANGAKPAWNGYIMVTDVDAKAAEITANGGSVRYGPDDIPEVGRFAVVADPQGGGFSLLAPTGEGMAPLAPGTPGSIGWHELHAADGAAAFDFYAARFGWTKDQAMEMGAMGTYQLFAHGGDAVGATFSSPLAPPASWLFYFFVDAIDAGIARITGAGGTVMMGPHEVPGGQWIVQAKDPQGAMFALVAPGH